MVAGPDGVLFEGAAGTRALDAAEPMTCDTLIWLASLTKALTATGVMQLVEAGRLDLDAPAREILPALSAPQVLEGFAADGTPRLRPARTAITLRHLLTHTSGFGYAPFNAQLAAYEAATAFPSFFTCTKASLNAPLMCEPGSRFEYGIGIDWAGLMLEAVTGQRLGAYLTEHVFGPLGMTSTSFTPGARRKSEGAGLAIRTAEGTLAPFPFDLPDEPEFEMGGGGVYSTVRDYLRFSRMLLGGGVLEGHRVLRESTVRQMATVHTGTIPCGVVPEPNPLSHPVDFFPGVPQGWGLSFLINRAPSAQGRAAGSFCWAGLCNAFHWVDPARGITAVLGMQLLPFFDPKAIRLLRALETAVYEG
jgi:CubicO group peptidase (beta-lactamase class C family)